MPNRDLFNSINPVLVLAAAAAALADNTVQVGAIVDHRGYGSATYIVETGTLADADATFAVTLDESDNSDMSGSNAVAAADLIGTLGLAGFTFAADGKCRKLGYKGQKRYTRLTITPTANSGNAPLSAICINGHPRTAPTANPPA